MSNALWVYCRKRPELPADGHIERISVHFAVRAAEARDEAAIVGQHQGIFGGSLAVEPGDLPWVVELDFSSSVEFDAFTAGGTVIALRAGGGLLWSPVGEQIVEVVPDDAARGFARLPLPDAIERAFDSMSDDEWED